MVSWIAVVSLKLMRRVGCFVLFFFELTTSSVYDVMLLTSERATLWVGDLQYLADLLLYQHVARWRRASLQACHRIWSTSGYTVSTNDSS